MLRLCGEEIIEENRVKLWSEISIILYGAAQVNIYMATSIYKMYGWTEIDSKLVLEELRQVGNKQVTLFH